VVILVGVLALVAGLGAACWYTKYGRQEDFEIDKMEEELPKIKLEIATRVDHHIAGISPGAMSIECNAASIDFEGTGPGGESAESATQLSPNSV